MGQKRKRPVKNGASTSTSQSRLSSAAGRFRTKQFPSHGDQIQHPHPVISLYYQQVLTLRQYLLQKLPLTSKSRRRRILSLKSPIAREKDHRQYEEPAQILANLLDTTLIGVPKEISPAGDQTRQLDFAAFTQSQDRSECTDTDPSCPQSEIVDFVISVLFNRSGLSYQKPQHLLAVGFQRATGPSPLENGALPSSIPGIIAQYPNKNVEALKKAPWADVLGLLGSHGEEIMLRLLLDCGIFTCVDSRRRTYYQISGTPLSMLEQLDQSTTPQDGGNTKSIGQSVPAPNCGTEARGRQCGNKGTLHKPNSIIFVRRRMLYARPELNGRGEVSFGLRHIHVLNRSPSDSLSHTVNVMKYIFPRQFGLHNVFTSVTDNRQTVQPFKDYTMREDEIAQARRRTRSIGANDESQKIPKRLRGMVLDLVQKLQNRNKRCSYVELLRYYCPSESTGPWRFGPVASQSGSEVLDSGPKSPTSEPLITQPPAPNQSSSESAPGLSLQTVGSSAKGDVLPARTAASAPKLSLTDYATPASSVSAFCRAVLHNLIPPQFYGVGQDGASNRRIVHKHVDRFVRLRRFESLSLHEVCKGLKITCIPWLEPPNLQSQASSRCRLSLSDMQKRTELLYEFIYYIFDSILVPLIRTNFYVTESQVHRNRLFYFRHDVWRQLTEQPLTELTSTMLQEIKQAKAQRMLSRRSLGYGSLRLLPKASGIRPIFNLRRRGLIKTTWTGKKGFFLGPSINSTILPIYNMLNYERSRDPHILGSALHSLREIHPRLKRFKGYLQQQRGGIRTESPKPLYFVKLDIQSCFDTIPQHKLIRLVERLVSEEAYHVTKHVEIRQSDDSSTFWPVQGPRQAKAVRKFVSSAAPAMKPPYLPDVVARGETRQRKDTVLVNTLAQKEYNTEDLLDLLDEHVRNNLVRIGKKYFRQRNGIPQGSALSTILCNFFYAELEREVLGFLQTEEALLLRLIDDFLLITSNADLAIRFLQVMMKGHPAYGILVNPAKSLVNFTTSVDGIQIPRLVGTSLFPYCGNLIDTRTLEVHKDQERVLEGGDSAADTISNSLTVELARAPGRSFHRKVLRSLTLQVHPMYLDTRHNSSAVALLNLYASFVNSAMKMYQYMKSVRGRAHPSPQVVIRTIRDVMQSGYNLCQAQRSAASNPGSVAVAESSTFACSIQQSQVQYLAASAFQFVLGRKQTRYGVVLRWLELVWKAARPKSDRAAVHMTQVVRRGNATFEGWRF